MGKLLQDLSLESVYRLTKKRAVFKSPAVEQEASNVRVSDVSDHVSNKCSVQKYILKFVRKLESNIHL